MLRSRRVGPVIAAVAGLAFTACSETTVTKPNIGARGSAPLMDIGGEATSGTAAEELVAVMDAVNTSLEAQGADYRVAIAEFITAAGSGEAGGTVLSKITGNKQLTGDFVPFDQRRAWSGPASGAIDNITFAIDQSVNASGTVDAVPPTGGLTAAQTTAAIVRAMTTWEAVTCSTLGLTRVSSGPIDLGVVAAQNRLGGSGFVAADLQHAGWRDINFAGGVLGVTFTFIFGQNVGSPPVFVPSDVDNNGKADVAFREIYYDPSWNWADDGVADIDVESVAVHEAGHGLSQGHFGKVWLKNDGTLDASPRAVMNALYAAPFRNLAGTDAAGHCSIWQTWPLE